MTFNISVPYTEMILTLEAFEDFYNEVFTDQSLEWIIDYMFNEGYNMDIFFYDYNLETNLRSRYEK
jgi:2-methylisocitrate lyase-like PEP mutase family enzyme